MIILIFLFTFLLICSFYFDISLSFDHYFIHRSAIHFVKRTISQTILHFFINVLILNYIRILKYMNKRGPKNLKKKTKTKTKQQIAAYLHYFVDCLVILLFVAPVTASEDRPLLGDCSSLLTKQR